MNFTGSIAKEAYAGAKYGIQTGQLLDATKMIMSAWNFLPFVSETTPETKENYLEKMFSVFSASTIFNLLQQSAYRVWENKNNEWLYIVGAAIGSCNFTGINSSISTLKGSLILDLSNKGIFGSFFGGGYNSSLELFLKPVVSMLAINSINAVLGGPIIPFFFLSDFTVGGAIGGAAIGAVLKISEISASYLGIASSKANHDKANRLHKKLQTMRIEQGYPPLQKKV